jgi:hypothetical protein
MIRKKNKNVVEIEKNQAELKAREEELKRIQEEKENRKHKQLSLTNNLKKTYSHIRPTIIQGQRILKIVEGFEEKVRLVQVLASRHLQGLQPGELRVSKEVREILEALQKMEGEYTASKEALSAKRKEFDAYAEDEEESNEQESNLLGDAEQEKIYQELKETEEEITILSDKFRKKLRQILRIFSENSGEFQTVLAAIPAGNEAPTEENILKSCFDIIISLKFVFLKKLSTGFDEQETHRSLMERLKSNITENAKGLQAKEAELQSIVEERSRVNADKNKEINEWKDKLIEMKLKEEEKSRLLDQENQSKRNKTRSLHEERETRLKEAIARAIRDLQEQEKRNSDEETQLTRLIDEYRVKLQNFIQEYDGQMRDRRTQLDDCQVESKAGVQ